MKFAKELEDKRRVKWRAYYVNYVGLKSFIKEMEANPSASNENFMNELRAQVLKITRFYDATEQRLQKEAVKEAGLCTPDNARIEQKQIIQQEAENLKTFAMLNHDGIRKIAKKYDKKCGQSKEMMIDILTVLQNYNMSSAEQRMDKFITSLGEPSTGDALTTVLVGKQLSLGGGSFRGVQKRASLTKQLSAVFEQHTWAIDPDLGDDIKPVSCWKTNLKFVYVIVLACVCTALWKKQVSDKLDWMSYFTIFVTLEALFLLVRQNPPDVTLVFATLVLRVVGVLNDEEAWGGFSNDVVLSVAVLGVVSAGVQHTGVVDFIFMRILGRPTWYPIALIRLLAPALVLNVGVSNTCVMGVLIPVVEKWSKEIGLHQALFLMPLSFTLLISGTIAIFSTSSNLITQGLLQTNNLEPFGNFELALLALACTCAATVYHVMAVPCILKDFMQKRVTAEESPGDALLTPNSAGLNKVGSHAPQHVDKLFLATLQISGASLDGKTLEESGLLKIFSGGVKEIARLERMGVEVVDISPETMLQHYDCLSLSTTADAIVQLLHTPTVAVIALDAGWEQRHDIDNREFVEVVLLGLSPLLKEELTVTKEIQKLYASNCIAVRPYQMQGIRSAEMYSAKEMKMMKEFIHGLRHRGTSASHKLHIGDNLILDAPLGFCNAHADSANFASVRLLHKGKANEDSNGGKSESETCRDMIVSGLIIICMVAAVASNKMPLLQACLLASFALVGTGCLPQENAFNAIKIRTILTIVGAFGIGHAMGKTHVAEVLAVNLCDILKPFGHKGVLTAIFGATVGLGIVFHATAVVILMFPICREMSEEVGLPLHQAMAMMMIGAGCQMLSPVSYQTNLMAYACGDYAFNDFPRVGLGAVLCIGVVAVLTVEYFIPGS